MFRPIRPSSGQQSLGIPRIQFCQNTQITLKVVWYVAICKMSCVYVILKVELLKFELLKFELLKAPCPFIVVWDVWECA